MLQCAEQFAFTVATKTLNVSEQPHEWQNAVHIFQRLIAAAAAWKRVPHLSFVSVYIRRRADTEAALQPLRLPVRCHVSFPNFPHSRLSFHSHHFMSQTPSQ